MGLLTGFSNIDDMGWGQRWGQAFMYGNGDGMEAICVGTDRDGDRV